MKNIYHIFYVLTLVSILLNPKVKAQTWRTVGSGVASGVMAYCVDGNYMYIGCADTIYPFKKLHISVWNGLFWSDLPALNTTSPGHRIYKIFVFKSEIYVIGDFDSIINVTASHYLVRYDGKKWKNVGGGIEDVTFSTLSVQEYNNKLYFSNIYKAGGISVMHIACWDGSSWNKLGSAVDGTNTNITHLCVFNNKLCVAGAFTSAGGINASHIAFWDGNNWSTVGHADTQGVNGDIEGMFVVSNKLVVYGAFTMAGSYITNGVAYWDGIDWNSMNQSLVPPIFFTYLNNTVICIGKDTFSNVYKFQTWNGTTWISHSEIFDYFYPQSYLTFKNEMWVVGKFKFQNNPVYYDLIIYDGTLLKWMPFIGSVPGNSTSQRYLFQYNNNLFLTGLFVQFKHVTYNHIAGLNDAAAGRIEGIVYYDKNRDCIRDSGEYGLSSYLIQVNPGNNILSTNDQGKFGGYIDTGYKTISLVPHQSHYKYWQLSPCNPLDYHLRVKDTVMYLNNVFAIYPDANVNDLKVTLTCQSGYKARKGYNELYYLNYENVGTAAVSNGTIILYMDGKVKFLSALPLYNFNSGSVFSWDFSNLQPAENRTIIITMKVDSVLNIGDSVGFFCHIMPVHGDSNFLDNYDTLTQKIVSSIDPNDKQCSPDGNILATTDIINYMIRFQNTGEDTAYRVIVIDTVETEHLPLTEIEMKTTSHPYKLDVINNVLYWTFNNILLPDSTKNEPKSHGFIRYAAHLTPGLAIGTKIQNKAYIYFDYMHYVPSNRTLNTIVDNTGIEKNSFKSKKELQVYPNPASDKLVVLCSGQQSGYYDLVMFDEFGRKVRNFRVQRDEVIILNIADLLSGLYFIRSVDGSYSEKIIVTK